MPPALRVVDRAEPMEANSKYRWARFGIRTLLIGLTLVCVWLAAQVNWLRNRRAAVEQYETSLIRTSAPYGPADVFGKGELYMVADKRPQPAPPFPLNWFGEIGYGNVFLTDEAASDEVERIRKLFPEADVRCR
jgi:hypothetical protein